MVELSSGDALRFIRFYGRVSASTPCVMYHGSFSVIDSSLSSRHRCPTYRTSMGMYFFMNECHAVPLNTVADGLPVFTPELNDIAGRPGCHS